MEPADIGALVRNAREARHWSQEDLAQRAGHIGQSTIQRVEAGDFKRMPSALPQICAALDLQLPLVGTERDSPGTVVHLPIVHERDFKVYAAAEGGQGEIIIDTDPVDVIPRPTYLQHVKDAYGLVITGSSMHPEFRPGQIAFVNPRMPIIPGEVYIFYAEHEGVARATIKELKRQTEKEWRVQQHNPPKDLTLPRSEWRWAHMVVGKKSR
jgi:phage repressor protein C with HTH and peptisase S24 domain